MKDGVCGRIGGVRAVSAPLKQADTYGHARCHYSPRSQERGPIEHQPLNEALRTRTASTATDTHSFGAMVVVTADV